MAVAFTVELVPSALWPQGDRRDPLGIWGARTTVAADATGGEIKGTVQTPLGQEAAYVYTCYDAIIVQLTGVLQSDAIMCRLLTNWPNIDPQPGIQSYTTAQFSSILGSGTFTSAPIGGPEGNKPLLTPNQRFLLLYDPRPQAGQIDIIEFKSTNTPDLATFSYEAYGYFWDRSAMQAPGGLRHPGSN